VSLADFLLMWQPINSPSSKSLNSPDVPMQLVLLSNEQHTAFCLLQRYVRILLIRQCTFLNEN
jgi:hypothetical protein